MRSVVALVVFAGVVSAWRTPDEWCAGSPLPLDAVPKYNAEEHGTEFRGSYRDFALYVTSKKAPLPPPSCKMFDRHRKGNDGLWVLEFDSEDLMKEGVKEAKIAGLPVLLVQNNSVIVSGGEELPEKMGYDACGAELHKRVMSVADTAVVGPKALPNWEVKKYEKLAKEVDPTVKKVLEAASGESIAETITHLQNYNSRNSYSTTDGLPQALDWLAREFRGLGFEVTRHRFRSDMAEQVVAELKGTGSPEQIVVAGAHSDSRSTLNTSPTQRAPGADDNGSGTAMLLELAKAIHKTKAKFKHTIRLIAFTGEEQGLLGSRAIAREYSQRGDQIIAMFNGDMLGYRRPNTDITLAFMSRYADPTLTDIARSVTETYVDGLKFGSTLACCSDQQSFYENGYPSVGFFEHPGTSVNYPHYHRSTDLLEYLDVTQLELESKAVMACTMVFAEPL